MTEQHQVAGAPLASLLAYAERESDRRAKGTLGGTTWLRDDELAALLAVLRREVGAAAVAGGPG